jgi:uncharacterized membrane protein
MKLDNRLILIFTVVLTLVLFPIAVFTSGPVRIILSFICLIFFPGYALLSALFPKKDALGTTERIVLSFGASIAIVPVIGFILNFSPWGIRLIPILTAVGLFILVLSLIGLIRQQLLSKDLRFIITFKFDWPDWHHMTAVKKILAISVIIIATAIIGWTLYFSVSIPEKQSLSEFYILDVKGETKNYPRQVKINDPIDLTAVVINHENQKYGYSIQISDNGTTLKTVETGVLSPEEKWEDKISFTIKSVGVDHKIQFAMFKDGEEIPYFKEPLYLYIDSTQ